MFCGIEFQTIGAANQKALLPMALAVKGSCGRLSDEEQRGLGGLLKLISDEMYMCIVTKQLKSGLHDFH